MTENLSEYFKQDELRASVWLSKYAQKDEITPDDMHRRMAKEFARIEENYQKKESSFKEGLSDYGFHRNSLSEQSIYELFKDFKYIIPQGSVMSQLGSDSIGSLSNCFVIGTPADSYGGIFQKDEEMAHLMKRRGGVGIDISTLRPDGTFVSNAAKTSTGAVSFMHRYSNTTREVAQSGRRGALMISISINHPDVMEFIKIKRDLTQVTGANISIKLNNEFMKAVENDEDYILRFPCNLKIDKTININGKELHLVDLAKNKNLNIGNIIVKKIRAKEYWDEIIKSAHNVAEPGLMFEDNHINYSPDGVYEQYKGITTNPCFHPDTQIETEFGRIKIKDITKPMRVYSMDSDGKLVMSNASASFISKYNAKTLKITLKNGSNIQITPEHKMYVHNKGWVEAKDIQLGDRIAHLCRSRRGAKYSGVHLTTSPNGQKDQVMEHKLVYGPHEEIFNIHHLNRDTYNNNIENLELLTHSEHSRITALEDNPQNHQVRDELGKFISNNTSKKGVKTIVDLPEELKTNMLSRFHNCVESIIEGDTIDVYDIQVENTHCLIANNMVAHNCGEIFMQPYDACRLIAVNLISFVDNPFTKEASFNFKKFYEYNYEAMRLSDDLVDLELEYIERIIDKIKNDPEEEDVKQRELVLWQKVYSTAKSSRRTGLGVTALGDCLAALGLKYDSNDALSIIDSIFYFKIKSELDCTIDLSILRGAFEGWDWQKEFEVTKGKNDFYQMLQNYFPEQVGKMCDYGRRNVSWNTVAPTGTVSLMANNCTGGIEPLFSPYYFRRKKVNPGEQGVRVDFVDQNGDSWTEYPVLHPYFKEWISTKTDYIEQVEANIISSVEELNKATLESLFTDSPWYGSTANDIDWVKRVEIQGIIQKYITHSISSTINLPSDVSEEEVSRIYMESWKRGLKGITVYRDGSRSGVLITEPKKENTEFSYKDAPKRPKSLPCDIHHVKSKGKDFTVLIGLFNDNPYEVFALEGKLAIHFEKGTLIKKSQGKYDLITSEEIDNNTAEVHVDTNIASEMSPEQSALTRLISTALRHGANIKFISEQLNKSHGDITSFNKAIARALKKYIKDEKVYGEKCDNCGQETIIYKEGCKSCTFCGHSKCG